MKKVASEHSDVTFFIFFIFFPSYFLSECQKYSTFVANNLYH